MSENSGQDLKLRESSLRRVLEHSPIGVAIVARDPRRRLFVNQSFLNMFGAKTESEINAVPIVDTYVNPADLERLTQLFDDSDSVGGAEVQRKRLDGTKWWLLLNSHNVEFEGEMAALVWHFDITARKEIETTLAQQAKLLEELVIERTRELEEKENLLNSIIENVPVGLLIKGSDHIVDRANSTYLSWYGFDMETMHGRRSQEIEDFQSAEDAEFMNAQEDEVFNTGQVRSRQVERLFADGQPHTVNITKFPIYDQQGNIIKVGSASIDLTEQIQAQVALEENRRSLQAVIDAVPAMISSKDLAHRYIFMNRYQAELYGTSSDKAVGKTASELVGREHGSLTEAIDAEVQSTNQPKSNYEELWVDGNGSSHNLLTTKVPLSSNMGAVKGIVTVSLDITDRKQMEVQSHRLLTAIEALSESLILFDADDRIVFCNQTLRDNNKAVAEKLVPGTPYEVYLRAAVGKGLMPGAAGREEEWILNRLERHKNPAGPFEVSRQDGIYLLIHEQRLEDGGTVLLSTNITEAKKRDEALRLSEVRLRGAIESLQEAFVLFDNEDRLVAMNTEYSQINPEAQKIMKRGGTFEDLIRANVEREKLDEAIGHEEEFIRERLEQHRNPKGSIIRKHSNGNWYVLKESRTPEGGIALTFTDITEQKGAEEARERALMEAQIANRTKTEFLANMSHELRTPLNAILGFSDMLANETFGPLGDSKNTESVSSIHAAGSHLLRVIGEILDISKIEAGEVTLQDVEIDVEECVYSCVAMVKMRAQEAKMTVITDINDKLPALRADEQHLKQIVLNLLSNAIKFTSASGRITTSARLNDADCIEITVADTGLGIAAGDIPKILQPFEQVADSQTRDHEGTGLGLPICKSLMDLHGGSLKIESVVGKGTSVTVKFPSERTVQ